MDGFEKINLNNENTPDPMQDTIRTVNPARNMRKFKKYQKPLLITGGVIALLILFVVFGVVIPGLTLASQAKKAIAQAKVFYASVKQQDLEGSATELAKTQTELLATQKDLRAMGYLKFTPIASMYYNDGDHLINAGLSALDGIDILIKAVLPFQDVLGLKGKGTFAGSTQDRIQTAVTTLSKITPQIDAISNKLVIAQKELDQVDPNHYPAFFGGDKIKAQLTQVKTGVDEAGTFLQQARPLVKVLPTLLGSPTEAKYLVLFQNNAELRASGGFLTEYSIFRVDNGVIKIDSANDIYTLDASIPTSAKPAAPRPIALYLPAVPQLNVRDTNLSPDFITSMDDFNKLYEKASLYKKVDGIIAIDTHVLVSAMNILGDMQVDGFNFTTKINPTCNCADVIYQLESAVDQPVNYVKTNRKGVVADLMYALMQKAFTASPKLYLGPLVQSMITEVAQKHVLLDIYNQDAMTGLDALNATGRIKAFDGDYLHINDVNFGGAKSNMFTSEAVTQDYQIAGDGSVTKTITIKYRNPYQPSNCSLADGGLCLNATLRDWIRLYVPKGSQLVSFNGTEVKPTTYDESGKTVFEGFLTVRPLGSTTAIIKYTLPFKVSGSTLPALYQKQPGTNDNQYTVTVNGRQVQSFPLLQDTQITINK